MKASSKTETEKRPRGRPQVEKLQSISLNFDKETMENIEVYWRQNMYRNRTAMIYEAVSEKLASVKCQHCGAANPKGGRVCSVCLRPLSEEDEVQIKVIISKK